MARYVMASRRAGKFHETEKRAARDSLEKAFSRHFEQQVSGVSRSKPQRDIDRQVLIFEAEPAEVAAKRAELPQDVILEPEILHYPAVALPMDLAHTRFDAVTQPSVLGQGRQLQVTVQGNGANLEGAQITLFLRGFGGRSGKREGRTAANGQVNFAFSSFWTPAALIAAPAGNFWSIVVRGPVDGMTVHCPPLPQTGPLQWWHQVLRQQQYDARRGEGIRVGVADTGVGPHPNLAHVTSVGAFINNTHDVHGGADVDEHGSHVCGIIGARPPQGSTDYAGIAPGVLLSCARVFPPGAGANQADIVNAIDHLSSVEQVDLLNLSLGSLQPSEVERDAIQDALERGTLCICAAANDAGPVEYPAAFPAAVAISALGLEGWGPAGSVTALNYPSEPDRYGLDNLFLASFSCFGPEIDSCAPGNGIISTVPARYGLQRPYAALDGTSMASPAACAALAAILAAAPDYRTLPRNLTRAERARALLRQHARDVGLAAVYQGRGLPQT